MQVHPLRPGEWRPRPQLGFADRVGLPLEVDLLAAGFPLREVIGRLVLGGNRAAGAAVVGLCDGTMLSYSGYLQLGLNERQARERDIASRLRRQGHSGGVFGCITSPQAKISSFQAQGSDGAAAPDAARDLESLQRAQAGEGSAALLIGTVVDPALGDTVLEFESSCLLLGGVYVPDALRARVVPLTRIQDERPATTFAHMLHTLFP
jgi:hypothetical protein